MCILKYREYKSINKINYICFEDDDHDGNNETLFKVCRSLVVPQFIKQFYVEEVVGASHGLLCLHGYHNIYEKMMFVFWNTSIQKSIGIVSSIKLDYMNTFGFGVCPVTRDPTIVKIKHSWNFSSTLLSIEVFTLSSGV